MEIKTLLFLMLGGMVWLMARTIQTALALRLAADGSATVLNDKVWEHQQYGYRLLGLTVLYLLEVETKRPLFHGVIWDGLFMIHLPFATLFFLILLSIVIWFNGLRYPYHRFLGYACCATFAPTVLTGIPLLLRMRL